MKRVFLNINGVKNFFEKYYFILIVVLAIIVKLIITTNLPLNARDPIGADEYLMMQQAESLANGEYLGPYNFLTLVKGIGFPVFLAFSYKIGIPLLMLYGIFYAAVCLVALVPIRRLVQKKPLQLIAFLMLLFCPATLDGSVQLIYRNMLIVPQSVLLVSSLMMMYYHVLDNNRKKLLGWTLLTSFAWVFMWHTREDSIWSVPLVGLAWVIMLIMIIKGVKSKIFTKKFWARKDNKKILTKFGIISLPFLLLFVSIHIISFINYQNYGIYTTNQLNNSNYTKAVMLMMKIKPEKEVERVEITRETLRRLYGVSPTLKTLEKEIEKDYESKTGLVMAGDDNGEINEDLITWELIGSASVVGYYKDAQTAEKFWNDVYQEIKQAIDDGKLETRPILPSRSLIPWPGKQDSFAKLFESIGSLYIRLADYNDSKVNLDKATIDESIIRRYENISGGHAIRATDPAIVEENGARWVGYVNKIRKIYGLISPILFLIGILYYIGFTVFMIIKSIKKETCYFDRWIFLSATLGGLTVMLVGLGYVNAFMVNVYGYITSSGGLFNLFITLTTVLLIQDAIDFMPHIVSRWHKLHP